MNLFYFSQYLFIMSLLYAISQVKNSQEERQSLISGIYHNVAIKSSIFNLIQKSGGEGNDASYIFDETIVQFVKTAFNNSSSTISGDLEPYLMGIARNLWYQECKKRKREISLPEVISHQTADDQPVAEEIFLTKERYSLLHNVLDKLRSNCRAVLMHWANGFSMTEIAEKLGYQSEGMARKKKSQCLAELNDFLFQNPHIKLQLQ